MGRGLGIGIGLAVGEGLAVAVGVADEGGCVGVGVNAWEQKGTKFDQNLVVSAGESALGNMHYVLAL